MTTRTSWAIRIHNEAVPGIKALTYDQINMVEKTMQLLALEEDPRKPKNRQLNVCPLDATDKYWFRVRSLDKKLRILFRVLEKKGELLYVVDAYAPKPCATGMLQIMKAARRDANTYKGLAAFFRKVERKR